MPPRGCSRAADDDGVGTDEGAPSGEAALVEEVVRQGAVVHDCTRVGERELHRLDGGVGAGIQLLVEGQRQKRRRTLPIRWQLAHLDSPIRATERLHPLRPMRQKIVLREPRRGGDRGGNLTLVHHGGAILGQPAERHGELGQAVDLPERGRWERRQLSIRPLVGDAGRACQACRGEICSRAHSDIEPEPSEALSQVRPEPHSAGHGDRLRPVGGCRPVPELSRRAP